MENENEEEDEAEEEEPILVRGMFPKSCKYNKVRIGYQIRVFRVALQMEERKRRRDEEGGWGNKVDE